MPSFDPTQFTGEEFANEKPVNTLITPAKYHLEVVDASARTSKAGNPMWAVQYRVADDQPHANRRIFATYLLEHPSEQVIEIASRAISRLVAAAGGRIGSPEDLIGAHVVGTVGIRKGTNGYEDQNEVKFLDAYNGYKCPFDGKPLAPRAPDAPTPDAGDIF